MDDSAIVELYWRRDEAALSVTSEKYGSYLNKIAYDITGDASDCEECVNDTYLRAWNTIPPKRPEILRTYLARLARSVSIDCFRRKNSAKRRVSEYSASLDELAECVSGSSDPEHESDLRLLTASVEACLKALPERSRRVFLRRYFFMEPIEDIAEKNGMSVSAVKSLLHRTRAALKAHLQKEGFNL